MPTAALTRDLVLIMDSSGSIGSKSFTEAKNQTSRLIGLLCPIPPFDRIINFPYQYNQAAMVTYSTGVVNNFDFSTYSTTVDVQNAILRARYEGRQTNTHLAFDTARSLFNPSKGTLILFLVSVGLNVHSFFIYRALLYHPTLRKLKNGKY